MPERSDAAMADETPTTDTESRDDTPDQSTPDTDALGDKGKQALKAERDARRAAEDRAKAIETELSDLKTAAQKRSDKEAAEQGRWQELAATREADLQTTTTERDSLKERVETLESLATARLEALMKDLPKDIAELQHEESTPIEKRLEWAEKATKAAKAAAANLGTPGAGRNPPPANGSKPDITSPIATKW
jgi:chromosome segregation ATPase